VRECATLVSAVCPAPLPLFTPLLAFSFPRPSQHVELALAQQYPSVNEITVIGSLAQRRRRETEVSKVNKELRTRESQTETGYMR